MDERLEFFQTWTKMLQDGTTYNLGWSYIIAWFGIILTLIAALLYGSSGMAIKYSNSEIALVDHEEIVNRAFESSQHQPEYYDQNCTLRQHGQWDSTTFLYAPQPVPAWNYMYSALHQYG